MEGNPHTPLGLGCTLQLLKGGLARLATPVSLRGLSTLLRPPREARSSPGILPNACWVTEDGDARREPVRCGAIPGMMGVSSRPGDSPQHHSGCSAGFLGYPLSTPAPTPNLCPEHPGCDEAFQVPVAMETPARRARPH